MGEIIQALDDGGHWCDAIVLGRRQEEVYVGYKDWSAEWNGWISEERIREPIEKGKNPSSVYACHVSL